MCSWIPKPKFPLAEKLSRLNSYSRTYTWNNNDRNTPISSMMLATLGIFTRAGSVRRFVSVVCKSPSNRLSRRLLQIDRICSSIVHEPHIASRHGAVRFSMNCLQLHMMHIGDSNTKAGHVRAHTHTRARISAGNTKRRAKLFVVYLEATLQDLLGLCAANGAVDSDFLVTPNTERTHGVSCLREDGLLAGQLFQHLQIERKITDWNGLRIPIQAVQWNVNEVRWG